jgi:hypothetical protein
MAVQDKHADDQEQVVHAGGGQRFSKSLLSCNNTMFQKIDSIYGKDF